MITEPLFRIDPYLKSARAEIVARTEEGGLVVDKVVDTNADGVFADLEEASSSAPATFRVTVANTTDRSLAITSVVDVLGAVTLDLLTIYALTSLSARQWTHEHGLSARRRMRRLIARRERE